MRAILVGIIIVLVTSLILFTGLGFIRTGLTDLAQDTKCSGTVKQYAELLKVNEYVPVDIIDCPAKEIALPSDEEEAKNVLANEMVSCWDKYGGGELNLFQGEGVFCSYCSLITPKKDVEIERFQEYLFTKRMGGTGETYAAHLADISSEEAANVIQSYYERQNTEHIDRAIFEGGTSYGMIFVNVKGEDAFETYYQKTKNTGTALAATGVATAISFGLAKVAVGLMAIPGPGWVAGTIVGVTAAAVAVVGVAASVVTWQHTDDAIEKYTEVLLRPATEEGLDEMGCEIIPTRVFS